MFSLWFDSAPHSHCPCPGCTWKALPCSSDALWSHLTVLLSQSPLQGHLTWLCRAPNTDSGELVHFALPAMDQKQSSPVSIASAERASVPALPGTRDISHLPSPCIDTESPLHVTRSSEVLSLVLHSVLYG